MMRKWMVMGTGLVWVALGVGTGAGKLWAVPQAAAQGQAKPDYTLAEYNAYKDASGEQNPQQKITKLDAFVKQYPNSSLLQYAYPDYYKTYLALKNYGQAIDYCDRQNALGDKINDQAHLDAYYSRATAYYLGSSDKSFQTPDMQTKARDAAAQGLKTLDNIKKPEGTPDAQFAGAIKQYKTAFVTIAAMASMGLKDYPSATTYYKQLVDLDSSAPASHYSLGVAELQMTPPSPEGFWELARAIALKVPNAPKVQDYLKGQLTNYQQAACSNLIDEQVTSLITQATSSGDKPATLNVPSAADLQKARDDTANFLPNLQAGGDAGKVMWLASCGLEYPDVAVYAMEDAAVDGDTVTVKVYRPTTSDPDAAQKEVEAATAPNMEVKIEGQPEAGRIKKDDPFRFTGTLTAYSQSPFLLTWDKAKINAEDLPEEKGPGKKGPAKKAPAKKAPAD